MATVLLQTGKSSAIGIVMQDGEDWKTLRRFTVKSLRDFGLGKSSFEDIIKDEFEKVVDELDKKNGLPFCPEKLIYQAMCNNICAMIFGRRSVHEHLCLSV